MALKDWKKLSSTRWENKKIKRSLLIAETFKYNTQKFSYRVLVNDLPPKFKRYIEKEFRTRITANKFSMAYMRKY